MMVYKYRLHDPDSGKVLYEGCLLYTSDAADD